MPAPAPRAGPVSGAVVAAAPARDEKMAARDKFVVATEPSAPPPAPKRARIGFDVKIREECSAIGKESVDPLRRLKRRMEAERDALGVLLKKAALLASRAAGRSNVKTREGFSIGKVAVLALPAPRHINRRSTGPAEKQQYRVQQHQDQGPQKRARIGELDVNIRDGIAAKRQPEAMKRITEPKKQQPAAPRTTKGSMASRIDKAKEAMKKRRLEEIARAREKFRQELIEMEKAAMPDETIYPEDLEELGITAYQYDVTRTRKQSPLGSG